MRNNLSLWSNPLQATLPLATWGDFSDFFHSIESAYRPKCDVKETDKEFIFEMDIPGVEKEKIKIEVDKNVLSISGKRESSQEKECDGQIFTERSYGEFSRSFRLPAEVNSEKIEATQKDGVLKIVVPKSESAKPKQIHVA